LNSKRILVLNDVHAPFHDSKLITIEGRGLVLDVAKDINVDEIIINGDLLDFYSINSHGAKHPDIQQKLEDELIWGREFIEHLRNRFNCKITFIFGNHEWRLDRFILNNAPMVWGLLSLKNFMELERFEIDYLEYNDAYRVHDSNLFIQHSPPSYGVNGARTSLLKKLDSSHIYGCTHRMQHAAVTGHSGELYNAWFNGWLGSVDETQEHKRVFSYAKGHENWQKCFSIVNLIDDREYHVQQVPIINNRCVVDGQLYEA